MKKSDYEWYQMLLSDPKLSKAWRAQLEQEQQEKREQALALDDIEEREDGIDNS